MKKIKILIITMIYILLSKSFVNPDANVAGGFQESSAAYQVAMLSIFYIFSVILTDIHGIFKIKKNVNLILIGLYYVLALFSTVYSAIPLLTAFRGSMGIGFFFVILIIVRQYEKLPINEYIKFLWVVLISSFIASLIFHIRLNGYNFVFGVSSGYSALIACFLAIYYYVFEKNKKYTFLKISILIIASFYMKSFSAIIALYFSILLILFLQRKYIKAIILVMVVILLANTIYLYLITHPTELIFGKPGGAYLIGSGRFALYSAAFDLYLNKLDSLQSTVGVGFMAEREFLKNYDLTWSSDPHNSFILSVLGMGVLGGIIYLLFIIVPFIYISNERIRKNKYYIFGISSHLGAVVYGVTSSGYLGTPSILLIVTASLFMISLNKAIDD